MISIVIPAYRPRDSLPILVERIETVLRGLGREFEIIIVDDCSPDDTWQVLKQLKEGRETLRSTCCGVHRAQVGAQMAASTGDDRSGIGPIGPNAGDIGCTFLLGGVRGASAILGAARAADEVVALKGKDQAGYDASSGCRYG